MLDLKSSVSCNLTDFFFFKLSDNDKLNTHSSLFKKRGSQWGPIVTCKQKRENLKAESYFTLCPNGTFEAAHPGQPREKDMWHQEEENKPEQHFPSFVGLCPSIAELAALEPPLL